MLKVFGLFIGFWFIALMASGQHMFMRKIQTETGVKAHEIYDVFQDSKHYIWFASDGGIWRFDGKNYISYTTANGLPDNVVFGFFEDNKKRLWLKSYNNKLAYLEGENIHVLPCSEKLSRLMSSQIIGSMHIDQKGVIYQSYFRCNKIIRITPPYHEKNIELISLPVTTNNFIYVLNDGHILTGSSNLPDPMAPGLTLFSAGKSKILPINKNFINTPRTVCKLQEDGTYLLGISNVLLKYEHGNLSELKAFSSAIINTLQDKQGHLWVITMNDGLLLFPQTNPKQEQPMVYLNKQFPNSITQDSEGSYWITTLTNGLYFAPHHDVKLINDEHGLFKGLTFSLFDPSNQQLYCFHDKSLFMVDKNESITKVDLPFIQGFLTNAFQLDENNMLLLGTESLIFNIKTRRIIPATYTGRSLQRLSKVFLVDNDLYGINQSNLFLFSHDLNDTLIFQAKSKIRSILPLEDKCLLVSSERGLIYFDTKNRSFKDIALLPENYGIITSIRSPLYPGLILSVGKTGEIYFLTADLKAVRHRLLTLKGISIKHATVGPDGKIWLSSNKGIFILDKNYKLSSINRFQGLPSDLVNHISFGNNNVYASTEEGLVIFPEAKSFHNPVQPDLYPKGISVNGKSLALQKKYDFNYEENFIRISFQGLSFITNDNLTYWYRMKGIDNKWRSTNNNVLEFNALPPGNYNFELYAVNHDGIKSPQRLNFHFSISPPFWKTWWFVIGASLLLLALVFFIFKVRIRQIKKREAEKNEFNRKLGETKLIALSSQMHPHFVFNSINSIQHYVLANEPLKANKYLTKFSKLMRNVLEQSRKEQITLEEEIETVNLFLEMESLRFEDSFDYNIKVRTELPTNVFLVPSLIVQPVIENAIWHGLLPKKNEKHLLIDIFTENESLFIVVDDNGIGREEAKKFSSTNVKKESVGLKIVQERLSLLEKLTPFSTSITMTDKYADNGVAAGTKVTIQLPILQHTS